MGRPRREFSDKGLTISSKVAEWGRYGDVVVAPVIRRLPQLYERPVFWVAYDEKKIEDRISPQEHDEQALFVARARREAGIRVASFANGGWREEETAVKMKNEGLEAGMPDLILYGGVLHERGDEWSSRRLERAGKGLKDKRWDDDLIGELPSPLFVEMKRRNGSLSDIKDVQLERLEELSRHGWSACVAFGSKAAFGWLRHCGLYVPEGAI